MTAACARVACCPGPKIASGKPVSSPALLARSMSAFGLRQEAAVGRQVDALELVPLQVMEVEEDSMPYCDGRAQKDQQVE